MVTQIKFLTLTCAFMAIIGTAYAEQPLVTKATDDSNDLKVIETKKSVEIQLPVAAQPAQTTPTIAFASKDMDPMRYTLGPDDEIEITVMRHPEFSDKYPINLEGSIQYKFVGDVKVAGMTKKELEDKVKELISAYVINPEVNVTITEYRSKVMYIIGEVGAPGKYYMRADQIPIREALVTAGLPTLSASMRKSRLITPDQSGQAKTRYVDVFALLYEGDLRQNVIMHPNEVLYIPATVMAKVFRVISPVTSVAGAAAGAPTSARAAGDAVRNTSSGR
jgi:polysaccharide biosynthesis/export protein